MALRRMAELEAKGGISSMPSTKIAQSSGVHRPSFSDLAYAAGGKVTDTASRLGASPEVAGGLGYTANVATDLLPTFVGGVIGGVSKVPQAMQGAGRWLMGNALKAPLPAIESGQAARAVDTMLKGGFNVTEGSTVAMKAKIAQLGTDIDTALATSPATIKGTDVGQRLKDAYARFKLQVNPQDDLKAIQTAWDSFKAHPDLAGQFQSIPVALANKLKQGTYRALESKSYGELQGATQEAQKQLARGIKETVSQAVPDIAPKLAQQGELLNAHELAARQAALLSKRDPVSLGWIATNPLAAAGYIAEKSAPLKALIARLLYSQSTAAPASAGRAAGALLSRPEEQ